VFQQQLVSVPVMKIMLSLITYANLDWIIVVLVSLRIEQVVPNAAKLLLCIWLELDAQIAALLELTVTPHRIHEITVFILVQLALIQHRAAHEQNLMLVAVQVLW
jgi:hypothetical protein